MLFGGQIAHYYENTLIFCLTLVAVACRAEDYHLIQSQISDAVPVRGSVDSATVYVLLCPDQRVYVFRTFDSHQMEETVKHIPRGSVLHYDGNALIAVPKQAQVEALAAFCKKTGISFIVSPTN